MFFQGQTLAHIYGMVGPIDIKQEGSALLDTGSTVSPQTLASIMTLTWDFSRSNFEIAVSQEMM